MYDRIAIQRGRDQLDRPSTWQWQSTALSSLQSLFQVLRRYSALPQEHLQVFSSHTREGLEEQLRQENSGRGSASVTASTLPPVEDDPSKRNDLSRWIAGVREDDLHRRLHQDSLGRARHSHPRAS